VRNAQEVARRLLTVFGVYGRAAGAKQKDILDWLQANELVEELTPIEKTFLSVTNLTVQQRIPRSWDSERIIVVLWALGYVSDLPPADEQCEPECFRDHLPPYAPVDVASFIQKAKFRPIEELSKMREAILVLHWHARDGKLNNRPPTKPVNIGIIQERHRAINWVLGYDHNTDWDNVTTDT
jgi:Domain of unknown function (DUF4272)